MIQGLPLTNMEISVWSMGWVKGKRATEGVKLTLQELNWRDDPRVKAIDLSSWAKRVREEEELGSEFGTDERFRRDEQYPGNKSLVSTRNHLSPQILYSHHKLSEWFLPCMAMDKLGRQTFSETPKIRNQSVAQEGEMVCFYTGLVTTSCVEGVRSVEEPRSRPIRCHNDICPSSKHIKSLARVVIF